MQLSAGRSPLTAPGVAGELCAALDAGAAGLIVDLPGEDACDSARLDALMRAARRARGWGSWVRLVIPDPDARRLARLVALDDAMPVHSSVSRALAAAAGERDDSGPGLLTVSVSPGPDWTVATLSGEADLTVSGQLDAALATALLAGAPRLVLDLSALRFIDSACLRVLWSVSGLAQESGGALATAAPRQAVARAAELWGIGPLLGMHDNVAGAVAATAGRQQRGPRPGGTGR